jgi:hypothetical protein
VSLGLEERLERLAEMKRQPFPRCSIVSLGATMDPADSWAEFVEQFVYAEIVDRYLRNFVDPGDRAACPCCHSTIAFSWGIVHGQGWCSCGWPGTMYHYVDDDREDGDLLCAREVCGRRRADHVPTHVALVRDGASVDRVELRCPVEDGPFSHEYKPPPILRFTRLLWAHPYTVHPARR